MELRTILADDEEEMRLILRHLLSQDNDIKVIGEARDGEELVQLVKTLNPNLIVIDVEMPKLNGIEASKIIRGINQDIYIIFATAYDDFRNEAFEIYATDYIKKPYSQERLIKTLGRIKELEHKRSPENEGHEKTIELDTSKEKVFIKLGDILYIESLNRQVIINTQEDEYVSRCPLYQIEEKLDKRFLRSHKSFIVNTSRIKSIGPYTRTSLTIHFENSGKQALLSSNLREELNKKLKENLSII